MLREHGVEAPERAVRHDNNNIIGLDVGHQAFGDRGRVGEKESIDTSFAEIIDKTLRIETFRRREFFRTIDLRKKGEVGSP